jgi:DNA gyrase subunit A
MVALVGGVPRTINLKQALQAYIDHQVDIVTRRTQFRLDAAQKRAHIIEGRVKALDVIDAIIAMIRASEDGAAAKAGLMTDPFGFSEEQAEDILQMPLRRLTRLSRIELETELAELRATIEELESILADEVKKRTVIKTELAAIRAEFATPRRSVIAFDPGDMSVEDLTPDQELVITMSKVGYVKAMPADTFRVQGRGGRGVAGAKLKDDDYVVHIVTTTAHQYLLFFSNRGRVYRLKAHEIPMKDRAARGTAIVNLLPLAPDERIEAVIDARSYGEDRYLFFCTKQGQVKKTLMSEYDSSLRSGIIALNIRDDDELVKVIQTTGSDDILMISRLGIAIRFNENEVRAMGRAAAGVRGMKMKPNDVVVSCDVVTDATDILLITDGGFGKRTKVDRFNVQGRGGQGVIAIKLPARRGHVVAAFTVELEDEILVITDGGVTARMAVREISSQGRDATGVRVQKLDPGQSLASVAKVLNAGDGD